MADKFLDTPELPATSLPIAINILGLQIQIGRNCKMDKKSMRKANCGSYSPGPEILKYFQDVADEYELRKYIKFEHQIVSAVWSEERGRWNMRIKDLTTGIELDDWCNVFINASGFLKYVVHNLGLGKHS